MQCRKILEYADVVSNLSEESVIGAEEAHSSFLGDGSKVHGFAYVGPERGRDERRWDEKKMIGCEGRGRREDI